MRLRKESWYKFYYIRIGFSICQVPKARRLFPGFSADGLSLSQSDWSRQGEMAACERRMAAPTDSGAVLSNERTARRDDGRKIGSQELQLRRSDSFMTPMPGAELPPAKGSPDGEEIPKCKLAFEEVMLGCYDICPATSIKSHALLCLFAVPCTRTTLHSSQNPVLHVKVGR